MIKKKILFLGGANSQIPAIQYARDKGLYVITADYLPDNPGHKIADEYHNISTINKEEILKLAILLKIDAISAFASDPAAPTAAYVSDMMSLVGGSYKAVSVLSEKTLFRKFLIDNNFLCPWFLGSKTLSEVLAFYNGTKAILKPVDSSGSKGIVIIENQDELISKFEYAKSFSHIGKIILEQYIERKGPQIHGEGFVVNGELIFLLLGDQIFSKVNNLAPYSTTVPSSFHQDIMPEVETLVKTIIHKSGFKTGGINIEVIRTGDDKLYCMEIGARNGGNYMPQLMKYAACFDLAKANVDVLLNEPIALNFSIPADKYFTQIILHSNKTGIFKGLNIPEKFLKFVCEKNIYAEPGQQINEYKNSQDVVGVLILESTNKQKYESMLEFMSFHEWVKFE